MAGLNYEIWYSVQAGKKWPQIVSCEGPGVAPWSGALAGVKLFIEN